ncbi:MAG: tRNA lysidine(34) synthetase TilS [Bacteroidales bacterium]|nr:tRNA lysidine(34) synthetase TilS [Bacteroidales bacterium]
MDILLQSFTDHIRESGLFCPADRILLAVSGGVDSVVMTDLFAKAGYSFGIAHCNFHLRGSDSDSDEAFVRSLAEKYRVPVHCIGFDTTAFAKEHKLSIEEAARKLRYDFFDKIAEQHGYRYIATAHHNNDAIETFFINLIRGTGLTGLHGIRPVNGKIIRPLLPFSRQEISDYASRNSLPFHEDYTNNETVFLRNKIRHQLLPLLKEMSPQIEPTMMRNMANLADAEQIFHEAIAIKQERIFKVEDDKISVSKDDIRQLNPCNTYLFEMLRQFGFNATAVNDLLSAIDSTGRQFHSQTHTILTNRDTIIIKEKEIRADDTEYIIEEGVTTITAPIHLSFEQNVTDETQDFRTDQNTIVVDSQKLKYPLILRRWRQGDRFQPFGMKTTRKVSDFFKDNHLSLFEKNEKWLLCNNDGQIIWIVGMRMDDRFKVAPQSEEILMVKFSL